MSSRNPTDPTDSRDLLLIAGGGLLVLVCCAGPALLAAGVLGALGGVLRSPVLVGVAVLAIPVGAVAIRHAGHRDRQQSCCPPSSNRTGGNVTGTGGPAGGKPPITRSR